MKPLLLTPPSTHKSTVILLHGLGDSGHGWYGVAQLLSPHLPHTKWILPHAPNIPITLNYGASMPGWYDIISLNPNTREDEVGLYKSIGYISSLISEEIESGIPSENIVLAGFSQGAAMTLLYGISTNVSLVIIKINIRLD
jgi:predicted esterase